MPAAKNFNKLKELTPELYMDYKRRRLSDRYIAKQYKVGTPTLRAWRRVNNLPEYPDMQKWHIFEKVFPKEVARLKRKYLKYFQMGWTLIYIGEEMEMTPTEINRFRERYFPEHMKTKKRQYTAEELETMKKNGITRKMANSRRALGWPVEEAISAEPMKRGRRK